MIAANQLAALVSLAVIAIVLINARAGLVRTSVARLARGHARRRHEAARLRTVRRAGELRERQYLDLRRLIRACDAREATRFDLDGLLDDFARLSVAHMQQVKALELAGCLDSAPAVRLSERRRQIHARRLEQRDRCALSVIALADAIETIDDLIRLIVQQRAVHAPDPQFEQDLDRRLADLDEISRAHGQLDAVAR